MFFYNFGVEEGIAMSQTRQKGDDIDPIACRVSLREIAAHFRQISAIFTTHLVTIFQQYTVCFH